ncbi:MAG: 30S ribosomal protein S15 [Candidatus Diapherotrites archaeon]
MAKTKTDAKPGQWVDYQPAEIEELILNLSNQGMSTAKIGMALRDQYGVPNVKALTQKRIGVILKEKGAAQDIPQDLLNLIEKSVTLQKHMNANKKDYSAKRGYRITVSKIRRLVYYYTRVGKLPSDWRYTQEKAALLVK